MADRTNKTSRRPLTPSNRPVQPSTSAQNSPNRPRPPQATILSLPIELRLKIYKFVLDSTHPQLHSIRPQRRVGWNKPHADLSDPVALFEDGVHPILRVLLTSRVCRRDHTTILAAILHNTKVLCTEHKDYLALSRVGNLADVASTTICPHIPARTSRPSLKQPTKTTTPDSARNNHKFQISTSHSVNGISASTFSSKTASSIQARAFAETASLNLRIVDFADKLDEIICQPSDIVKLIDLFTGLREILVSTRHSQRYNGTIEEHIRFVKSRATEQVDRKIHRHKSSNGSDKSSPHHSPSGKSKQREADVFRRLTLRSPVTDGHRMSPSPSPSPSPYSGGSNSSINVNINLPTSQRQWQTVDASMLVWQHFLYPGPPYKCSWRPAKYQALLDAAFRTHSQPKSRASIDITFRFSEIQFDTPSVTVNANSTSPFLLGHHHSSITSIHQPASHVFTARTPRDRWSSSRETTAYKAEMSTKDWIAKFRQRNNMEIWAVKQRQSLDELANQADGGLWRCRHKGPEMGVCNLCREGTT